MSLDRQVVLVIVLVAALTYALRCSGYLLRLVTQPSPRVNAGLAAIPGGILVALVVPAAIDAGVVGVLAVLTASLIAIRFGGIVIPMLVGVILAALLRFFI